MANRDDLDAAAAAGVIQVEQVAPLHDFLSSRASGTSANPVPAPSGEEDLRFIRNFHDVFLAVGIVLFAIGLAVATATFAGQDGFEGASPVIAAGCAGAAGVMWLLGEFFARRRRLFLPAIAICVSLTGFVVFAAVALYYASLSSAEGVNLNNVTPDDLDQLPWIIRALPVTVISAGAAAVAAFYLRFRLPFSMGLLGSMLALLIGSILFAAAPDFTFDWRAAIMFGLGVLLFLAGVAFDARDPARTSRMSDNGFWLHLAAAPLILNGALGLADPGPSPLDMMRSGADPGQTMEDFNRVAVLRAAVTLVIVALLGIVSLLINRRALIVSALVTTGVAIGVLMNATGLGQGALIAGTLVVLGGFVLIIGASWHTMRRALLGWVRPGGVWSRVFPPETPA